MVPLSLSHTVAIVTGASSGLGAAAARCLVRQGARVLAVDLGHQRKAFLDWAQSVTGVKIVIDDDKTKSQSEVPFGTAALKFVDADVSNPEQVSRALDAIEKTFGEPVNAAINCAGIALARKTLSKKGVHPLEDFVRTLTVNTAGSFNVGSLAAERMSQREADDDGLRGCIVNTASIAAFEGQIGQAAYAASKGGVVGMTLPMARDLAGLGIRVMTIAPGLFETPLLANLPDDVKNELGKMVPCPNRLGKPDEFGKLAVSILQNPLLNGSVIRLDGALRMPP